MEPRKPKYWYEEKSDDHHHYDARDHRLRRVLRDAQDNGYLPLLVIQHVEQAEREYGHHVYAQGHQEHEEVAVIPAADAVVHPWTVVVECLWQTTQS